MGVKTSLPADVPEKMTLKEQKGKTIAGSRQNV